ncbi:MAG TPA: LysR family transcriptional regulator [Gammaproteobacteria bacterium]|nr:LysR family transcriptional regulator [Gammaproteobacteria bacterium]
MSDIKRMMAFAQVVESGSFSAAAKRMGIARSAVSRHVAALEREYGVRLLNRSTRRLSLTEAGRVYYESCARILAEAEAASQRIRQLQEKPTGTLKVAGPTSFGLQLAALVHEFQQRHASLSIELQLDDRVVDMVEEGIDLSIRIGWLEDSRLIARRLCDSPRMLCASPAYIERRGRPATPSQLAEHECIIFTLLPTPHQWHFSRNKRRETVQVHGRLLANSAIAVRGLVLNGAGIAPLSRFLVREDLASGRLERLLPEYDCGGAGIYAVYHDRRYRQPKVRLFIDFVQERLRQLL